MDGGGKLCADGGCERRVRDAVEGAFRDEDYWVRGSGDGHGARKQEEEEEEGGG